MSTGFVRRVLSLAALLVPLCLFATRVGPPTIRQCYGCSAPFLEISVMSGNTAGAVFATDGRVFAPMLPIAPRLVKCRKCKEPIWAPACKILGTASERQWKEIPWPEDAREGDCLKFVDTLSAGDEREKPVRIRAWWARSDMFPRSSKEQVTTWTDAQRANVLRLKNLLDAKDPDDRVMIAEIERQLGNFEACLKLLDFNFPEHLGLRVRKMRELASAKRAQAETVER